MTETRRSPRVLASIPILVAGEGPLYKGHTAVVNRHGALILVPTPYPVNATVEIQNQETSESAKFRVVWLGGLQRPGLYKIGVELLEERPDFWNVDYAEAAPAP